jgi:hypothetical protein
MKNVDDLSSGGVRNLRRAFGKLRHRKFWKSSVSGGVAAVEVTNIGNGWHPHLHAVVDSPWLSNGTAAPSPRHSPEEKKRRCQLSAEEVQVQWSKCLKQPSSSIKICRANRETIAREVLKYTVKNEDLILCEGKIGDLIRALDGTRLMTTFGKAHGQCVKDVRLEAKEKAKAQRKLDREENPPPCYCGSGDFLPDKYETQNAQNAAKKKRVTFTPSCAGV